MLKPHYTASIEVSIPIVNSNVVYMDIVIIHKPNEDGGAEYETSQPYILIKRGDYKLPIRLELMEYSIEMDKGELQALENEAHELANGIHPSQEKGV